jgi:hypothetical protein
VFWLLGFGAGLSLWFGNNALGSGGDAWGFVWLSLVFLVGMFFADRK